MYTVYNSPLLPLTEYPKNTLVLPCPKTLNFKTGTYNVPEYDCMHMYMYFINANFEPNQLL